MGELTDEGSMRNFTAWNKAKTSFQWCLYAELCHFLHWTQQSGAKLETLVFGLQRFPYLLHLFSWFPTPQGAGLDRSVHSLNVCWLENVLINYKFSDSYTRKFILITATKYIWNILHIMRYLWWSSMWSTSWWAFSRLPVSATDTLVSSSVKGLLVP